MNEGEIISRGLMNDRPHTFLLTDKRRQHLKSCTIKPISFLMN